jgi:hypothetical protein
MGEIKIKIIPLDVIILGIIDIVLITCNIFHSAFWGIYFRIFDFIFHYFMLECILKILIPIINIIKTKNIKPTIYLENVFQFIVSAFYVFFALSILFHEYDRKVYFTDLGIPLLIIGISSLMFQLYWVNNLSNTIIRIISNILTPFTSLVIMNCFMGIMTI